MEYFYVIELKLSEYHELSWAYINALQTRDVIIVPGIGNTKLDNEAMNHFIALYPHYRGRIYQVQMKEIIEKWGGALNCCTWTISEEMSINLISLHQPCTIATVAKIRCGNKFNF